MPPEPFLLHVRWSSLTLKANNAEDLRRLCKKESQA